MILKNIYKKIQIIITLLFVGNNLYSQINLVGNGSFEISDNNSNFGLQYWSKRNSNDVVRKYPDPAITNSCIPQYYSDISSSCRTSNNFNIQSDCGNGNIDFSIQEFIKPMCGGGGTCGAERIFAKTGTGFIGLEGGNELDKDGLDNDLGDNLELNTEYRLSFYYLLPIPSDYRALDFRIYLSPSLKNSKLEIASIKKNDVSNNQPGVWYKFEKVFKLVNNNHSDLHVLSLINFQCVSIVNPDNGEPFEQIFIDDVSLTTTCGDDPCSPYVGKINIKKRTDDAGITSDIPFCINGLSNIKKADITISVQGSGVIIQEFSLDRPKDQICFDLNGYSPLNYIIKVNVENDCRKKELVATFTKDGTFNRSIENMATWGQFLPPFSAVDKISTNYCCNPDLKIENQTISGEALFESKVKITLGPNVTLTSTSNVRLRAGQTIDIIQPILIDYGANFIAEIGDCTPSPVDLIIPIKNDNDINKFKNTTLLCTIYPNPTNKNFNVNVFDSKGLPYEINLTDIMGKSIITNYYDGKLTNTTIETNGLANGVYFVTIKCGDKERTEKLIIQSNH